MGVYYDIYTEVLFNGNWINIDSRVLGLDNKLHHAPVIAGQSWMREALNELSDFTYFVEYDKLADGTKSVWDNVEHTKDRRFEAVDFQTAIKDRVMSSPTRRGYVNRSHIAMFQTREIDSIEWCLTPGDFAELDKEEQREYSYYEWDDREGWYAIFKEIAYRVDFLVDAFNDRGIPYEMYKKLYEKEIYAKNVRLVVVTS